VPEGSQVKLTDHPRARRQIATAKGWAGMIGLVVVFLLSRRAHMSAFESGLHALAGGIGLYLLAWAGMVAIWRELAVAEVERARRIIAARAEEAAKAQAENAAA
jgi:hypothetical protein